MYSSRAAIAASRTTRRSAEKQILGVAAAKEVRVGRRNFQARFRGAAGYLLRGAARGQHHHRRRFGEPQPAARCRRTLGVGHRRLSRAALGVLGVLLVLLVAAYSRAQVAIDASTSASAEFTGTGTSTLLVGHTTTANRHKCVDAGRRFHQHYQLADGRGYGCDIWPARRSRWWERITMRGIRAGWRCGTCWRRRRVTHNVHVSVNVPAAGQTVGVVAGATTFTGVDQTVPLGTFVSADGAAGALFSIGCARAWSTG